MANKGVNCEPCIQIVEVAKETVFFVLVLTEVAQHKVAGLVHWFHTWGLSPIRGGHNMNLRSPERIHFCCTIQCWFLGGFFCRVFHACRILDFLKISFCFIYQSAWNHMGGLKEAPVELLTTQRWQKCDLPCSNLIWKAKSDHLRNH